MFNQRFRHVQNQSSDIPLLCALKFWPITVVNNTVCPHNGHLFVTFGRLVKAVWILNVIPGHLGIIGNIIAYEQVSMAINNT